VEAKAWALPHTEGVAQAKSYAAKIKVRLADGKERRLQHMTATSLWSADGRPMSAAQCFRLPSTWSTRGSVR